jgi:hypothetical protein
MIENVAATLESFKDGGESLVFIVNPGLKPSKFYIASEDFFMSTIDPLSTLHHLPDNRLSPALATNILVRIPEEAEFFDKIVVGNCRPVNSGPGRVEA